MAALRTSYSDLQSLNPLVLQHRPYYSFPVSQDHFDMF